ncbi:Hypothetical predicted protein [Podarcis lilfordi]|uniref:Uncharacterized protein n=1 Tax=Podarcis lilfordi TaxID=74358 RepID=A0AA35P940_9SAUR|nr:Hypothetical predicted protein [Podarcis lilfordi]
MKPSPEILQPTDPLPPKPVVQLTASLQLPNGLTMEVPITIDSGSNADFIGLDFLQEHNIALLPATLPLKVVTVDGRELLGAGGHLGEIGIEKSSHAMSDAYSIGKLAARHSHWTDLPTAEQICLGRETTPRFGF